MGKNNVFVCAVGLFVLLAAMPVYAHTPADLLLQLTQQTLFAKEKIETIFASPQFHAKDRVTTSACDAVRKEAVEDEEEFARSTLKRAQSFYKTNLETFTTTEKTYGVPPEYILAIIRIETYFGICLGDFRVLKQLTDMYLKTNRLKIRTFALKEIKSFLLLAEKEGWATEDALALVGSASGAFGLGHFIPSSFVFAVDGNDDGKSDLFNPQDAIPSIANYLINNGWHKNKERAILRYNRDQLYLRRVLTFAEKIKGMLQNEKTP